VKTFLPVDLRGLQRTASLVSKILSAGKEPRPAAMEDRPSGRSTPAGRAREIP
jgi:hypothetical protein